MTESAKHGPKILEGIFAVDKPQWATSAGVIRDLKTQFRQSKLFESWIERTRENLKRSNARPRLIKNVDIKIGHGGTLDPLATGVLVVGVGRGTKQLTTFLECTKDYECVLLFGAATDSYDAVGKIVGKKPYDHITKDLVEENLDQFRGKIMQKPSIFSALKVDGKKMYEYAREGGEIPDVPARPVTVESLELIEWYEPGSHKNEWPDEEFDGTEKEGAQRLLGVRQEDVDAAAKSYRKHKRSPSPTLASKRARASSKGEDGLVTNSNQHPRSPEDDKEPSMSGALPVEENFRPAPTPTQGPPAARFRMTVTSGFYVRSFCHDLGVACGSYGLMSSLIRTRQSDYALGANVFNMADLEAGPEVWEPKIRAQIEDYMNKQGWDGLSLEK